MLKWALVFFVVSIIAGLFGFRGVQGAAKTVAKALFFVFIVMFVITLLFGFSIL
jgi:uncharacterized membrane protein YtjA (UPF0391 family)